MPWVPSRRVLPLPPLFATEGGPTGPRTPPASWGLDSVRDWPDGDLNLRIRTFGADAPSRLETLCGSLSGAIVAGEISGVPARELHWLRGPGPATTTLANRLGPVEGAHRVRVHLESPLDLKVDNVASSEPPTLALLATAIRRRAILLATAWGNPSGSPVRQPPLAVEPFVPARCKVRGVAIRRWSAHQGRAMYLRGIVGWLDYEPVNIEAMTWLRVGEILGVGRHTTMGFGRIRVEAQR